MNQNFGGSMVAVFVTFRYGSEFNEETLRKIAAGARSKFEGMPGLHSKTFTVDRDSREATNFYVWESEAVARAFFTDALRQGVTKLYGVAPSIRYAEVAELVENR